MSKTVADKMGIKAGHRVLALNAPRAWIALLGGLPDGAKAVKSDADFVLLFVESQADVARHAKATLAAVGEGNLLWMCYPKKSSAIATDLSRDVGWGSFSDAGWEPVAIVSVDDTWSGFRWKRSGTIPARVGKPKVAATAKPAKPAAKGALAVPADLVEALARAPRAKARFEAMAPSHRREHVRAIEDAKRPETRARRIAAAVEKMLAEA